MKTITLFFSHFLIYLFFNEHVSQLGRQKDNILNSAPTLVQSSQLPKTTLISNSISSEPWTAQEEIFISEPTAAQRRRD